MAMDKLQHYIRSARLRTLPLSVSGVLLGYFLSLSLSSSGGGVLVFVLALLTAVSLQVLSNFANELGDMRRGTDDEHRLGPIRSIQRGGLTEGEVLRMLYWFVVLSALLGSLLVWVAFGTFWSFWAVLVLLMGVGAIWAAIKYTFGDNAYGYVGLGDVFVFLFFGWVGVLGIYILLQGAFEGWLLFPASAVGLLCVAMLNVNNMRDVDNDRLHSKKTLAVRMGVRGSRFYHSLLVLLPFLLMGVYVFFQSKSGWSLLFFSTLPLFVYHLHRVLTTDVYGLDGQMQVVGIGTFLFSLLGGIGCWLGS